MRSQTCALVRVGVTMTIRYVRVIWFRTLQDLKQETLTQPYSNAPHRQPWSSNRNASALHMIALWKPRMRAMWYDSDWSWHPYDYSCKRGKVSLRQSHNEPPILLHDAERMWPCKRRNISQRIHSVVDLTVPHMNVPHVVNVLILFPNAHPHFTDNQYRCVYTQKDRIQAEGGRGEHRGWIIQSRGWKLEGRTSTEERQNGGMIGRVSELWRLW